MIKKYVKKSISLLLVLIMMLSLLPTQAFAVESSEEDHEHCEVCGEHECTCEEKEEITDPADSIAEPEFSDEYLEIQAWIDDMLCWYLANSDEENEELLAQIAAMSSDDVADKVIDMNVDDLRMAQVEIYELKAAAEAMLTNAELKTLKDNNQVALWFDVAVNRVMTRANTLVDPFYLLNKQVSITDTFSKVSALGSDNGAKITVSPANSCPKQQTNYISIKNETDKTIDLTFDYKVYNVDGIDFPGTDDDYNEYIASNKAKTGTITVRLAKQESCTVNLLSRGSGGDGTLELTNFIRSEVVLESADITVNYDSNVGKVTTTAGTEVKHGEKVSTGATGVTLVATPASNDVTFLGWINPDTKEMLKETATYTIVSAEDMTVVAAFKGKGAAAWFQVGGDNYGTFATDGRYYSNLNEAVAAAQAHSSYKTVIPVADGTLLAGNYTIPSGITLLIPRDSSGTVITTEPLKANNEAALGNDLDEAYITPTPYRTLTMASGANITVDGAISVAGAQFAGGRPVGGVHGPVGFICMESGSKITVKSGGNLYAWGYVMGAGEVEILSGGTVYESFQVMDWRGGNATSQFMNNDAKVFPMNQYYIQNVEVPMKLNAGATVTGYTCTTASKMTVGTKVPLVGAEGSDSLFTIKSGYLLKDYDESTDRQTYKVCGDVSMRKISISISGVGTLDSSKYVLPITNNLTIDVVSGTIGITEDLAFLPGSEIIIREDAICNLASGKSVYVYGVADWLAATNGVGEGFVAHEKLDMIPLGYAPGRTGTRTELADAEVQIGGTVNADIGFLYTTQSGADIIGLGSGTGKVNMKKGTATVTYQATQDAGNNPVYHEVPIVVAQLQNADGTTTNRDKVNVEYGTTYTYTNGKWVAECNKNGTESGCKSTVADEDVTCNNPQICQYCDRVMMTGDHAWGEIEYAWEASNGTVSCVATQTCGNDGCENNIREATAEANYTGGFVAKCGVPGEANYEAEFLQSWIPEAERTQTTTVELEALSHAIKNVAAKPATCTAPGNIDYYVCGLCFSEFKDDKGSQPITEAEKVIPQLTHVYETYVYNNDATCRNPGTETAECENGCGIPDKRESTDHPQLKHEYDSVITEEATCEEPGLETFTCKNGCNSSYTKEIPAKNHSWSVSYKWSDDGKSCTAIRTCANSVDCEETCEAAIDSEKTKEPTCEGKGETTYTATFEEDWAAEQTKTVADINATDHAWTVEYDFAEDGKSCTATRVCGNDAKHNVTVEGEISSDVDKEATCTGKGATKYTATFKEDWATTQTKTVTDIDATEHAWSVDYSWAEDGKSCTATHVCGNDASHNVTVEGEISSDVDKEATCTEMGATKYTATFEEDWAATQTKTVTDIDATDHAWTVEYDFAEDGKSCTATRVCGNDAKHNVTVEGEISSDVDKEATCTEMGATKYTATFKEDWAATQSKTVTDINAMEHAWSVDYSWAEDGKSCLAIRTCSNDTSHKESCNATITSEVAEAPTCLLKGETTYTASFAKDWAATQILTLVDIEALGHKDKDFDHVCDNKPDTGCDVYQGEHGDVNPKDHVCDYGCKEAIGEHADIDHDVEHLCDHCGVKVRDHEYTDGVCDCGYVKDLNVSLVITASGADDLVVPQETIKYGTDYAATLDFSAFGKCFTMDSVSIKVGGNEIGSSAYAFNFTTKELTIDGSVVTDNIEIVVTATQRHSTGESETNYTAPNCTDSGKIEVISYCGECGVPVKTTTTTIPALGHNGGKGYSEVKTEATFQADAYITYSCGVCGDSYVDVLEGTRLTAIALIGEDEYETLDEAIAAAEEGDTIVLQTQVAVEGDNEWNLTGITLETADCGYDYGLVVRGNLIINGGTFRAAGMFGIGVTATGELTVNDGEFEVVGDSDYLIGSYGTVTINGGSFAGQYNCVNGFAGTVSITGGAFVTEDTDCTGEYASEDVLGNVSVTGGTYSKDVVDYLAEGYCRKNVGDTYVVGAHVGGEIQIENAVGATCKDTGSHDEVTYCVHCGEEIHRVGKVDPTLPHTEVVDKYKAPTCEGTGLTEGSHCSACGETIVAQEVIPATKHDYDDGKYLTDADKPTCTETGVKTFTCQNDSNHTYTEVVDATDHDWSVSYEWSDDGKSCTAIRTCANSADCEETCEAAIDSEKTKGPTCEGKGETTYTATFEVDWAAEQTKTVADIGATDHDWTVSYKWSDDGKSCTAIRTCANSADCEETCEAAISSAKTKEPTCEGKGETTYTATFEVDWAAEQTKTVADIDATDHDWTVSYKWEEDGSACVATRTCANDAEHNLTCEAIITSAQSKAPTCTATGKTKYTATFDAEWATTKTKEIEDIDALEHAWDITYIWNEDNSGCQASAVCKNNSNHKASDTAVITFETEADATCETVGSRTYTATFENEIFATQEKTVTLKELGHSYTNYVSNNDATCTEDGTKTAVCDNGCGTEDTVADIGSVKGHSKNPSIISGKVATCAAAGYKGCYQCLVCHSYFEESTCITAIEDLDAWKAEGGAGYLEKKPHTEVIDPAVEASCTVAGKSEGKHCSVCGETIVAQEDLGTLEHTWDEGRITTEPDCENEGVRTFTCGTCRGTKTEVEPALDHDLEYIEAKQPTYSSAGWEAYERCLREDCGYTTYKQIPMLDSSEISDFTTFMKYFKILEEYANDYVAANPGKDPAMLVIKYIRTGVDRYNSGSWNIMAGYEDAGFAEYVKAREDEYNSAMTNVDDMIQVTSLKNIKNFTLPNGDYTDIGHMFGTMDISYTNVNSVNHADVSGWTGDLVDLLSLADQFGVNGTLEEMMEEIEETYFLKADSTFPEKPIEGSFSKTDFYGDLDGFYVMQQLTAEDYEPGRLYEILSDYFAEDLTLEDRADYLLKNRLGGVSNRGAIRDAVYSAYTQNQVITMLEGTREFKSENLTDLRKACCYVFADYLCKLAGDYVEESENIYFSQFSSEKSTLAPGITQEINKAHTADNKQIVYYIATADLSNQYVDIYANYNESDPSLGWKMSRVKDQADAAQKRYGDPESEDYIPNYTVVTAINGAGFDMSTGEPGGLLIMGGVEYHAPNDNGFFGILKDGTAKIGTTAEYYELKEQGQIMEGIACFGATLVKDGKIAVGYTEGYTNDRASRTAVGITKTGKVVFMVLDGRQEPVSCGGSMQEIAQIMLEAGCVHAVNLDGGGSTTYLAKQEGEDSISLVSKPSDGYERSVSTSLIMVSTAPSSTEFDHATISASPAYLTVGAQTQLTAAGVSPMGNAAELPEGTTWQVADESKGTITDDGVFTAKALGDVNVDLMLDGVSVGTITLHVVNPTQIYFTRDSIDAVYGVAKELPLKALYNGKEVAFLESDVEFSMNNADAGVVEGFVFTASEEYTKKSVTITASLVSDSNVTASINVSLFDKDAYYFDFDNASGGTRQFAWIREVSNTATVDNITYSVVDREEDVVATYSFGIDMTQIPMPERIADLTYMLPGADVEGANAWTFLLQLAERISPMSEVRPVITFDSDVEVDYSELSIVCEYFQLAEGGVEFDEETNTLTLRLNWKDQTQAIDPETANPICILSGIKVTPKDDAAWDSKDRLSIANVGEISYTIYMRANALYSFSQKPENQEVFGLYPYEDGSDRGGYFTDIYHKFEESYTLDKGMKNGWLFEGEGYAYYVDDEKLLGVQKVDGFYYNFGENGLNIGQTKYTGIFKDGSELRYARVGVVVTSGWPVDGEDTYHCHSDGTAHKATVTNPITCIRGGRLTYSCTQCGTSEVQADFIMPNGHTWDDDHVCTVCGTHGKNIADARIGFGTITKPVDPNPIPRYYYQAGGVRPGSYVTFNNVTVLSWSNDANVNPDGTMKDLYISWTNNRGMGKAYIEFAGKGDYYGTYRLEYHIIPNDVKNLKVTATTEDTITLKWDAAAGAGYYRLYFLNADGSRTLIDGDIKGLTYTVGGLEEGKSYSFQVASSAISTDGEERVYNCAKWSNTAIGTAGEALDEGGDTPGGDIGGGGSGGGDIGGGDIGGGGGDLGGGEEEEDGNEEEEDTTEWENPFIDVSETAYYADAIAWAVQNGITSGTTETTFSPDRTCTRANAVTFLWRAAGCPEPTTKEMPFSDVDSNAYYYKAVLWAMEQGITMGTTASTFDPNAECTRGQIVTFLWRAEKSPEVSADNPFADVHSSAYYADSVLWAVKEGITNGTSSTTFNPSNDCTRAQIVTFLWRNAGSKE